MKNQRLEYKIPQVEKADMVKFVKKAMKSCSEFNSMFLKERKEERIAYFDMQTMNLHYPRSKFKVLPPEMTKPGTARLFFFFLALLAKEHSVSMFTFSFCRPLPRRSYPRSISELLQKV